MRRQRADVSLVVPSAPWPPRDPLQLCLQQQWCIPPTAIFWRIQALTRRTVAIVIAFNYVFYCVNSFGSVLLFVMVMKCSLIVF